MQPLSEPQSSRSHFFDASYLLERNVQFVLIKQDFQVNDNRSEAVVEMEAQQGAAGEEREKATIVSQKVSSKRRKLHRSPRMMHADVPFEPPRLS